MSAVAARCPFGLPAAVEVLPYDGEGRPFPTLYYLTCPTAVAAVARLESAGGVERLQGLVETDEAARAALGQAVDATQARRRQLLAEHPAPAVDGGASLATGVGAVADASRIKCLHAHAAHGLAHPGYRLGAGILAEAGELWCGDRRCVAYAGVGDGGREVDDGGRDAPRGGAAEGGRS
jgi:uncharacterized protein